MNANKMIIGLVAIVVIGIAIGFWVMATSNVGQEPTKREGPQTKIEGAQQSTSDAQSDSPQAGFSKLFQEADTNRDQQLSLQELEREAEKRYQAIDNRRKEKFSLEAFKTKWTTRFQKLDTNGDGLLTRTEIEALKQDRSQ